jgi:hypothetical protein
MTAQDDHTVHRRFTRAAAIKTDALVASDHTSVVQGVTTHIGSAGSDHTHLLKELNFVSDGKLQFVFGLSLVRNRADRKTRA